MTAGTLGSAYMALEGFTVLKGLPRISSSGISRRTGGSQAEGRRDLKFGVLGLRPAHSAALRNLPGECSRSLLGASCDPRTARRRPGDRCLLQGTKADLASSKWMARGMLPRGGQVAAMGTKSDADPATSARHVDEDKTGMETEVEDEQVVSGAGTGMELAKEVPGGAAPLGGNLRLWPPGEISIPPRYQVMVTTSLAFVICNMDKVNMSVAIIPMSQELRWSASLAGVVQSSFFWGYALSQLPGGWLARRFTGRRTLRAGVFVWSLATAAVPLVAGYVPSLLFARFLVGLGEGISPPAAIDVIARSVPLSERSRAIAFVFGGFNAGSVLGLLVAPTLIETFGWQSVFYLFGIFGILWCAAFGAGELPGNSLPSPAANASSPPRTLEVQSPSNGRVLAGTPDAMLAPNKALPPGSSLAPPPGSSLAPPPAPAALADPWGQFRTAVAAARDGLVGRPDPSSRVQRTPWGRFLRSPAVWAVLYGHFCNNWGHYVGLSWLPSFFSDGLHLDLAHASYVALLPPLASVAVSSLAAPLADSLISKGVDTTLVRKMSQSVAFLGPALCMLLAAQAPGWHWPAWSTALVLSLGFGLSSFAFAGLYSVHQDISPKYASILLGLSSSVGAIPGIVGVPLTGVLLDNTHSWALSLFAPSIFFYLTGTVVWLTFASSEEQDFDS